MRFFPNCWRSNRSARGTKTHAERRIDASRGHAVVPGVVQLAFRHGIASVSEFVPADTHVIPPTRWPPPTSTVAKPEESAVLRLLRTRSPFLVVRALCGTRARLR